MPSEHKINEYKIDHFRVCVPLRVRYHEVDMQNIVFNANYLVYADIASTDYFRALSNFANPNDDKKSMQLFEDQGGEIMARHADLDFRAPAKFDDIINLHVRTSRIGNSSFTLQTLIMKDNEILNIIHVTYVYVNMPTQKPTSLPDSIKDIITRFENAKPMGNKDRI